MREKERKGEGKGTFDGFAGHLEPQTAGEDLAARGEWPRGREARGRTREGGERQERERGKRRAHTSVDGTSRRSVRSSATSLGRW
ncbi:hypothetical protein Sjap_023099 [Stephania japonica]|uniref:Uncharacterized protein n=1 Tax=Stephania japonica TaxID=461633 RepID=A0AAP0HU78_9MAGN